MGRPGLFASATILAAAIVTAATAGAQTLGKTLDEIAALAKKEPPVRVASVWQREIINEIGKGFKAQYGLSFTHDRQTGLDTRERILNEAIAGVLPYDLVNVSGELRSLYVKANIIALVDWKRLFPDIDPIHFSPDGNFVATGFSQYGIVYNPKLVKNEQVPKRWEDCLLPHWKGKLIVQSRGRAFTALWQHWGREKSLDFHRRLRANEPVFSAGQTEMIVQIASGEQPMACGIAYHSLLNILRKDPTADVKYVVPPEMPFHISEAFAVMRSAKSPNAAVLLAAYSAKQGQPAYRHIGRTSPFVEDSEADKMAKAAGAKKIWGGWDFQGDDEVAAAKEIVTMWGFRADTVSNDGG
jgi:iron(III) transport system substrate-binding protein